MSVKNNYVKDWCLINSQPRFLFLTYCYVKSRNWSYYEKDVNQIANSESHNYLNKTYFYKLSRPLIEFCRMWIFSWIKLSWHSWSMWDKIGWLSWFWQFLCEPFPSFNLKGFYYSYAWPCSLCEGRFCFCTGLISRKLCKFLTEFWTGSTSLSVLLLFPLLIIFLWLCMVFDSISSNIGEVLLIHSSANEFVFDDFNIHHGTDWLIPVELIDLVNPDIIFPSQMSLLTWLANCPTWILDCYSRNPAYLDFFLSFFWH